LAFVEAVQVAGSASFVALRSLVPDGGECVLVLEGGLDEREEIGSRLRLRRGLIRMRSVSGMRRPNHDAERRNACWHIDHHRHSHGWLCFANDNGHPNCAMRSTNLH